MAAPSIEYDYKVVVKDLPLHAEGYARWRYALKSSVLAAIAVPGGPSLGVAQQYLAEVEATSIFTFEDLHNRLDVAMSRIDLKLFHAILMCCKGASADKYLEMIEARCVFGCGRQALRILDVAHRFDIENVQAKAATSIVNLKCRSIDDLMTYLARFRLERARVGIDGLSDHMTYELLRSQLSHVKEAEASFALHQSLIIAGSASVDLLISNLELVAAQFEEKRGKRQQTANVAKGNPKGSNRDKETCFKCGAEGHRAKECPNKGGKSGKGKGKGKGSGSGG